MVVENQPPYGCSIFQPGPAVRDLAEKRLESAPEKWRVYIESREWPGYGGQITYVSTPFYVENEWEMRASRDQIENDGEISRLRELA